MREVAAAHAAESIELLGPAEARLPSSRPPTVRLLVNRAISTCRPTCAPAQRYPQAASGLACGGCRKL